MCQNGEKPIELGWTILVLFPKGNTDTQGISLMETLWKVVEAIIDTRLREIISFHGFLHGLCVVRLTGATILDLKLAQDLASIYQGPLFLVFLDLR